jgi:uncharacterized lipoprotein YmbA
MRTILARVAAMMAVATVTACGSSKPSNFYTLSTDPGLTRTADAAATPMRVVVNPVTVPDLIDRPQIVTRREGNEVQVDEFSRWAEPLKGDIARVIAGDIGVLLGTEYVTVFDVGADSSQLWRVRVDVMRFDATLGDSVEIEALWTVWPPEKRPILEGRSLVHEAAKGAGYDAIVAAHNRALASVSRDIASAIHNNLAK